MFKDFLNASSPDGNIVPVATQSEHGFLLTTEELTQKQVIQILANHPECCQHCTIDPTEKSICVRERCLVCTLHNACRSVWTFFTSPFQGKILRSVCKTHCTCKQGPCRDPRMNS